MTLPDKITAEILAEINTEQARRNRIGLPGFPWNTMKLIRAAIERAVADEQVA